MMKKLHAFLAISMAMLFCFQVNAQTIFQETFEGSFPPAGWVLFNNGTGNNWTQNTLAANSYEGTKSMQYNYNFTNAADAWAFMPSLPLNTNPVTVTFFVRTRTAGTYSENLKFTVGSDTTVASQTTVLMDSTGIQHVGYAKWVATFTPPTAGNYVFAFNCYSIANQFTLYVDSISVFQLLPPCTGKPNGGVASGPSNICPSTLFNISNVGATLAGSVTYQWQSSINNGTTWSDIAGANGRGLSTTESVTTQYRLKVKCGASNDSAYSNVVNVVANPATLCYCGPNNGVILHGGTSPSIDSVAFLGTTLGNANIGVPSGGYTLFPDTLNTTCSLMQAVNYTLVTKLSATASGSIWIDWNQNGIFDSTEWTQIADQGTGIINTSILVPPNAKLGKTGMRVRSRGTTTTGGNNLGDACTEFFSGETEDYLITIVPGIPCTGKPSAGLIDGVTSICNGVKFDLIDTGATSASGINYQWQFSTNGGASWSDIPNASNFKYSPTITVPTQFRFKVVCTASHDSSYSNTISVSINSPSVCYCSPDNGTVLHSSTGPTIDSVAIVGTTLDNNDVGAPSNGYTQFPDTLSTTASLKQAVSYDLVTVFSGTASGSLWIDWDQNGHFDSTEWVQIADQSKGTLTTTFVVPANAKLGKTGMRIRTRSIPTASGNNLGDACTSFGSGETEDYIINIIAGTPCTGKPNGGVAFGDTSVCNGIGFSLRDTGFTSASGISYQWQSSTNGTVWTDITGATSSQLKTSQTVVSYYRFKVVCSNSKDSAYSNVVNVKLNPTIFCYCSPNTGVVLHSAIDPSIDSVEIIGTTLGNADLGAPANGYTLFDSVPPTIATLTQAVNYSLVTMFSANAGAAFWVDWNQNGIFDANEYYKITDNTTGPITTVFTVPTTAKVGSTLLRIRSKFSGTAPLTTDACANYFSGETEDYVITVAPGVNCTGKPNPGLASGSTGVCAGASTTLIDTGATSAIGISYQWQTSTNGTVWTDVVGANSYSLSVKPTVATQYRYKVNCSNSNDSAYSNIVTVSINPANLCYCGPNTGITLHSSTGPTIDTVAILGTSLKNINIGAPTNGYTLFAPIGAATANLQQGGTYSLSTYLSGLSIASVWGDWNQNGKFDSSEWTQVTTSGTGTIITTITVPTNAKLGLTGLRIRSRSSGNTNGIGDPCTSFGSGETEDYYVTVVAPSVPSCTKNISPANGVTLLAPVTLKWNVAPGAAVYYVYLSSNGGNTYTLTDSATTNSYLLSGLSAGTTYYWYIVPKNSAGAASGCVSNATSFKTQAGPPNDSCGSAPNFNISSGTPVNGTVVAATPSLPPADCGGVTSSSPTGDVWYSFTTNATGSAVTITLYNVVSTSQFDPAIFIYSGTLGIGCSGLNYLNCVDDNSTGQGETITLTGLTPKTTYYIRVYGFIDVNTGTFTIKATGAALPITLKEFKGERQGSINKLFWTTVTEQNNTGYEVQRSIDGKSFYSIGFVNSTAVNGNSNKAINYQFIDEKPLVTSYYRLKQIDKDGKSSLSNTVVIKGTTPTTLSLLAIYPNPAKNVLNALIASPVNQSVTIIITDLAGKLVKNQSVTLSASAENIVPVEINQLVTGNYLIKVICNNGCESAVSKFFKQ